MRSKRESGPVARTWRFAVREAREIAPAVVFFFIGFNLILLTKQLFLSAYFFTVADFMLATVSALIVGKVVLIGEAIPFMRRYDSAPLIYSILFKTVFYTVLIFVVRLLEAGVPFLIHDGGLGGFFDHLLSTFSWRHFIATQLWIITLFLVYLTGAELARLLGHGELYRIFFKRRTRPKPLTGS